MVSDSRTVEGGRKMIHLEGNWYIDADETEFILLEQYERPASEYYKKKTGQDVEIVRKVAGYYTSLRNAVKGYRDMLVRKAVSTNEYARISGALRAVAEIDGRIEELLKGVDV